MDCSGEFIAFAVDTGVLRFGEFKTKAGRQSPYFFNAGLFNDGASLNRLLSHMWLTTEGVFGIALGVSTGTIFVYVLFGTLLDRAGGGN